MWKKTLIIAGLLLLLIGLLVLTDVMQKSSSRQALAAYIEELRAQGEVLTWKELGYPPRSETNGSMAGLLSGVGNLGRARPNPARLEWMSYLGPGRVKVGWSASHPLTRSAANQNTNAATWEQFTADMAVASNALAEIRTSLQNPPHYFPLTLTNPLAQVQTPRLFVEKRTAAQWLSADSLAALHEGNLVRAQVDLQGLTQLVQMHRQDASLGGAMIRVAISGLGLSATWEALQTEGWNEDSLAMLQHDWEAIDLFDALERGFVGERIFVVQLFENPDLMGQLQAITSTAVGGTKAQGLAAWGEGL